MEYDIVIATKDRIEALRMSIPLMLAQDPKPSRVVVVDASRNHDEVVALINSLCAGACVDAKVISCRPNLPAQRNCGLDHVRAPVVMYPDDDALWFPGFASGIIAVYARDTSSIIVGVSGSVATGSPLASQFESDSVGMSFADRIGPRVSRIRSVVDGLWPDPFYLVGRDNWRGHVMPSWFQEEQVRPIEYMGGYRMSFRTEVLRSVGGFDADLGGRLGWAAGEDADASFAVCRWGIVVGAGRSKVYHHRFPGPRGSGFLVGCFVLLNRAYIIGKHARYSSAACSAITKFGIGKLSYYSLAAITPWARDRVRGVLFALNRIKQLNGLSGDELRATYHKLVDEAVIASGKTS